MKLQEALNILKIDWQCNTLEEVKAQYKKLIFEFHPDRNPAGLEISKIINAAFAFLEKQNFPLGNTENNYTSFYCDDLSAALNKIINLNLTIEVCGHWIWVSGNTYAHRETLKTAGFSWAKTKKQWSYHPSIYAPSPWKRRAWDMDKIRATFGSDLIREQQPQPAFTA